MSKKIVAAIIAAVAVAVGMLTTATTAEAATKVKPVPCKVAGKPLLCAVPYNPYA